MIREIRRRWRAARPLDEVDAVRIAWTKHEPAEPAPLLMIVNDAETNVELMRDVPVKVRDWLDRSGFRPVLGANGLWVREGGRKAA